MMDSKTEKVLFRSQLLSNPPYSGKMYYSGFEIALGVCGKLKDKSVSSKTSSYTERITPKECLHLREDKFISTIEGISATDDLLCDESIRTFSQHNIHDLEELKELYLKKEHRWTKDVEETIFVDCDGSDNDIEGKPIEHTVFSHNGTDYLVKPVLYPIYDLEIEDVLFEKVTMVDPRKKIPENIEQKIAGKITLCQTNTSSNGNNIYSISTHKDKSFRDYLQSIFVETDDTTEDFKFELRKPTNNSSLNKLYYQKEKTASSKYSSEATVESKGDTLIITTEYNKQNIKWKINLSDLQTIPEELYEEAKFNELLLAFESNQNPFVKFKRKQKSNLSEIEKELLDTSEMWLLSHFTHDHLSSLH